MNFLIETKQEYTIHLVNAMYPLIYEGLQSIYEDARKMSTSNDELINFQRLLKAIPSWNPMMIESEYNRILRMNTLGKTIEDLLKAVIKANIVVLTNTNIEYDEKLFTLKKKCLINGVGLIGISHFDYNFIDSFFKQKNVFNLSISAVDLLDDISIGKAEQVDHLNYLLDF
jgi:hypothetical protein